MRASKFKTLSYFNQFLLEQDIKTLEARGIYYEVLNGHTLAVQTEDEVALIEFKMAASAIGERGICIGCTDNSLPLDIKSKVFVDAQLAADTFIRLRQETPTVYYYCVNLNVQH